MNENLLVIDDEVDFLKSVKRALITVGYKKITLVSDPKTVADILEKEPPFDIAVIDITMPEVSGMEVLSLIKRISSSTECLMMTARDETQLAVACLQRGAYDYLVKPMSSDDFLRIVEHGL